MTKYIPGLFWAHPTEQQNRWFPKGYLEKKGPLGTVFINKVVLEYFDYASVDMEQGK